MEIEQIPDIEVEWETTLSGLKILLKNSPEILGDELETVQEAVRDAEREIQLGGRLSEGMAEKLDELYRPFKQR